MKKRMSFETAHAKMHELQSQLRGSRNIICQVYYYCDALREYESLRFTVVEFEAAQVKMSYELEWNTLNADSFSPLWSQFERGIYEKYINDKNTQK